MDQKDIAEASSRNREQGVVFPTMQDDDQQDGNRLRNAVRRRGDRNSLEAVDDQQRAHRIGKHPSQIEDRAPGILRFAGKIQKGRKRVITVAAAITAINAAI